MILMKGILFVELVKPEDGWLWRSDRVDNKSELGFDCLVSLWWKELRVGWRVLIVRWRPMHYVVHFSRRWLLRRLVGVLLYLSFGLKEDGAIFPAVVSFTDAKL
jgi:hypothetical protein